MFGIYRKCIWYLPQKSNSSFYFIHFRRLTVNRVPVFRTKRQRIVRDRIPGSIAIMTDCLKKKKILRHNIRQVTS